MRKTVPFVVPLQPVLSLVTAIVYCKLDYCNSLNNKLLFITQLDVGEM